MIDSVKSLTDKYNIRDISAFTEDLSSLINLILKENKPYLVEIDNNIKRNIEEFKEINQPGGDIVIHIKLFNGEVQSLVLSTVTKVKFN